MAHYVGLIVGLVVLIGAPVIILLVEHKHLKKEFLPSHGIKQKDWKDIIIFDNSI